MHVRPSEEEMFHEQMSEFVFRFFVKILLYLHVVKSIERTIIKHKGRSLN